MADLLTVATVARHLGLTDYEDQRTLLDEYIDAAQSVAERIMHRSLATATNYTEWHDASGPYFYVDRPPIVSISALVDDAQNSARSITLTNVVTDSYDGGRNYKIGKVELWDEESGYCGLRLGTRINYTGGWTTATLPDDVRQAWIDLVAYWFNNPDRVSEDTGAVPPEIRNVFLAWRCTGRTA